MKKVAFVLLPVVLVLGIVFAGYQWMLSAVDASSQSRQTVEVTPGMSVDAIGALLKEKGVIRSPLAFKIHVKLQGKESSMEAGKFVFHEAQSTPEIVEMLQSGKAEELIVTIPEGFTVKDIDSLLASKGLTEEGDILNCLKVCDFSSFEFLPDGDGLAERGGRLEGYLFPDTYYIVAKDFVPKFFLERMMTTFRKKVVERFPGDIEQSDFSLHELVTIASLVESESQGDFNQRRTIAAIILKRAEAGWGLGIDATVRYIVDNDTAPLTVADLNVNSPYNTRKFQGLPPGPVSNAGIDSFRAVFSPAETSYWYYLHGTDGQIHYALTNEEHNMNKHLYLK